VLSVDGILRPAALELSHWPGNRTPAALRHDLSTGCALAFARLDPRERASLARGAVAIANNHYDTDGCLALLATRFPERALPHADAMLRTAAAGDFYRVPDRSALALDALVSGLADPERSPLRAELAGLADEARWERCAAFLCEHFPALLAGDLAPWRELFEPEVEAIEGDLARLAASERADLEPLDLSVWTERGVTGRAPGRHALHGSTRADRLLWLASDADGTRARFLVSTLSWFDLASERRQPRPDLEALARRLDELEGSTPAERHAWRVWSPQGAAPELWFGRAELEPFAEWNESLAPSRLAPALVRATIEGALSRGP
jgi:hypothetical protein